MKLRFIFLLLSFIVLNTMAQPCLKLLDLKKGKSFTFQKSDNMIVFIGNNKFKFRIKSVSDSGFISTNNVFFHKDSISQIRIGSSTSPAVYVLGWVGGWISFMYLVSEFDFAKSRSIEIIFPLTFLPSTVFYFYKIATGFKRNYSIKKYRKLFYFEDVEGLPKNIKN